MRQGTSYPTVQVDGLSIFYREAGPNDAPDPKQFAYTFDPPRSLTSPAR